MASLLPSARCSEPPAQPAVAVSDQPGSKAPDSITGNPAAENELPGTGLAGRLLQLPADSGLRLGGLWLVDTNGLISGGAQPGKWSWNSALIIGANLDAEKLLNWHGASFGIQFLQFNGQNTNGQAVPVKEYLGLGFTGFGLVPHRPDDSIGVGMAWSWLNPNLFVRSSELMSQGYYQARLFTGTFFEPPVSYIPTPGANPKLDSAWALTFRFTFLF